MQKPVQILKWSKELDEAARRNLESAVRVSLLLLPESFSATELFTMVAGLSYRGDFRMTFGENPQKVRNIVEGHEAHFHELYGRVLSAFPSLSSVTHDRSR
jgi:translocator assembly and maintenance protein 41